MDKVKSKKISKIILNVLLYLFLSIAVFAVTLTVFAKRDPDGAAEIFGYQMRLVTSESMEESEYTDVSSFEIGSIPLRSMIFVETMPDDPAEANDWYRELRVGDVLTFRYVYAKQETITHRITAIEEIEGGFMITLEGDNKNSEDGQLKQVIDTSIPHNTNYVIGKVTGQSPLFGLLMTFLMQPVAIILLIIVPCFLIIVLEVIKIIRMMTADKTAKAKAETKQKDEELEELRRKLAELEKQKNEGAAPAGEEAPNDSSEDKEEKTE